MCVQGHLVCLDQNRGAHEKPNPSVVFLLMPWIPWFETEARCHGKKRKRLNREIVFLFISLLTE